MGKLPAVIKGIGLGQKGTCSTRPFHFDDLMHDARQITRAAQVDAQHAREQARTEAKQIRQAARKEGYEHGYEAGLKEGQKVGRQTAAEEAASEFSLQQSSLIESCVSCIDQIHTGRAKWEASARRDLVDLAIAIGQRVAHHVGERERNVVLANLDEAVRLTAVRSNVTILVHPADADTARAFAQKLIEQRLNWDNVKVIEDQSVLPGGCRLQWGDGEVDLTLDTQLARIEAELRGDASSAPSGERNGS